MFCLYAGVDVPRVVSINTYIYIEVREIFGLFLGEQKLKLFCIFFETFRK